MNRDFKGVWIPKEVWINDELTWMEKLFFVEIDSLDNSEGCFASNSYFAEFFDISPQRCSQIINSLIKKKYLKAVYIHNGKEIKQRVLNIFDRGIKFSKLGIKDSLKGYQEKFKDNNTYNNTCNNTKAKRTKKFVKPTVEEIREYCVERNNSVNPQGFFDFYESKDWMIGKNKMKDFKAAVRTWEQRQPKEKSRDQEIAEIEALKKERGIRQ